MTFDLLVLTFLEAVRVSVLPPAADWCRAEQSSQLIGRLAAGLPVLCSWPWGSVGRDGATGSVNREEAIRSVGCCAVDVDSTRYLFCGCSGRRSLTLAPVKVSAVQTVHFLSGSGRSDKLF